MKKTIHRILPFIMILLVFTGIWYVAGCKGKGSGSLFGGTDESPLKSEVEGSQATALQATFRKVYELYKDRVVFITTEQYVRVRPHPFYDDPFFREFFGPPQRSRVEKRTGLGSGFIVSRDGYICTNHHVINGMDTIYVNIGENAYLAELIGSDARTDLALLKIETDEELQPVYFGDSDEVHVGDWAIAIGNPFGLVRTFTVGVISQTSRMDIDLMGGSHLQTDASINPGNSGGPLINIYGEVIGINRMIYSKSGGNMGIGFAIPVNTARSVLEQLKKHKRVKRGYIGVSILQMNGDYAAQLGLDKPRGAFVGEVMKGSPAHRGGIQVGDVILKINDTEISDYKDLLKVVGDAPIGTRLAVEVWRDRKKMRLFLVVAERPEE